MKDYEGFNFLVFYLEQHKYVLCYVSLFRHTGESERTFNQLIYFQSNIYGNLKYVNLL